jgi:hypothetical protein
VELFDDLPDGEGTGELVRVEDVLFQAPSERADLMKRHFEQELLEESVAVLRDVMAFRDVDLNVEKGQPVAIPDSWKHLPEVEQKRRLRVACAGWLPQSEAPVALQLASRTATSIIRAVSEERGRVTELNIGVVKLNLAPNHPVLDLLEDDYGKR